MAIIIQRMIRFLTTFENKLSNYIKFEIFPENFALSLVEPKFESSVPKPLSLKEILNNSILWAVPKKRKSIEKRRTKKYGCEKYGYKILLPKTNILVCPQCGSYQEAGLLCATCYERVSTETKEIQKKIEAELGIQPVEKDVVVLYEGEKEGNPELWQGKRIVEMKKPRPKIFSDNLMQKSTQAPAETKEVAKSEEISIVK